VRKVLSPEACHRIARAIDEGAHAQDLAEHYGVGVRHIYKIAASFRQSLPVTLTQERTQKMLDEWRAECQREAQAWRARQLAAAVPAPAPLQLRPRLPESHGIHGKRRKA